MFVQSLQNYFITSTFMQFKALELHQYLTSVYLSISDSLSSSSRMFYLDLLIIEV